MGDNVQLIVQQNGVRVIMDAIGKHPQSEKLMIRCIKTLDFIAMADTDYAAIVHALGAASVIKKIMAVYPQVEEIQESGQSALLFLEGAGTAMDDEDDAVDEEGPPGDDSMDWGPPPPPDDDFMDAPPPPP